jgi:hypothetical protein
MTMFKAAEINQERQRRVRRSVFWLAALALAFYIGFIVLSVSRARG